MNPLIFLDIDYVSLIFEHPICTLVYAVAMPLVAFMVYLLYISDLVPSIWPSLILVFVAEVGVCLLIAVIHFDYHDSSNNQIYK